MQISVHANYARRIRANEPLPRACEVCGSTRHPPPPNTVPPTPKVCPFSKLLGMDLGPQKRAIVESLQEELTRTNMALRDSVTETEAWQEQEERTHYDRRDAEMQAWETDEKLWEERVKVHDLTLDKIHLLTVVDRWERGLVRRPGEYRGVRPEAWDKPDTPERMSDYEEEEDEVIELSDSQPGGD